MEITKGKVNKKKERKQRKKKKKKTNFVSLWCFAFIKSISSCRRGAKGDTSSSESTVGGGG